MRKFATAAVAALVCCVPAMAALETGPKAGTGVAPFHVMDVTGEHAGNKVCYRCQYGSDPVVAIFATEINDKVVKACKELDAKLAGKTELKAFFVLLTDDGDKAEKDLKKFAKDGELKKLPLTYFEGKGGPKAYQINKEAGVSLIMWKDGKVEATKAYAPGKFCDECCKETIAAFCKEEKSGKAGG